ncbi:Uma2 family endonuclease [Streptomyces sp. NPDC059874]|uniref:Uma2 family endonuclease n=1 Tax=Streptomyces sp. NPDC059874 TaxID=3346983 RepID=UPI00365FD07F
MAADPERALKYAIQHMADDHVEGIEGHIVRQSRPWGDEASAAVVRQVLRDRVGELGCFMGSGDLDLPGSPNWYVPDIAVVPKEPAKGGGALLPDQTLLIVEVTSESNAETDRVVKRRRYAEYGAPLYLLVDRVEGTVTLFSEPGRLGYTRTEGPHPFGTALRLPEPFGIELDTSEL